MPYKVIRSKPHYTWFYQEYKKCVISRLSINIALCKGIQAPDCKSGSTVSVVDTQVT